MHNSRILHTMLRVGDMQRSINFYTQVIGMRVLRTLDQPTEKYTLAFLGFGEEDETCALELTYNYGITEYNLGTAYGHIAISVDDCYTACADIISKGGKVIFEPAPLPGCDETIAFIVDPDGYPIELIHRSTT